MYISADRRLMYIGVLAVALSLTPHLAVACSCVASKEKASEVREWMRGMLAASENVVLLRAVDVQEVGDSHERAVLRVIKSWKGKARGALVYSDTSSIGGGMCDMSIKPGEEILVAFDSEPIAINGCPSDFELTYLERKYLDLLAPRYRKKKSAVSEGAKAEASVGSITR